jgi:2-(1,2-epoxy-1,2-dihydrophenyl)acetyl-CoA isomerase
MFRVSDTDSVRTLVIDNPARRNAIGPQEFGELGALFEEFEASDARVLLVTGAGEDFCSGLDLTAGGTFEGGVAGFKASMEQTSGAAISLFRCTKPTVAAVDGVAAGAGINLALGCDIVLASDRARFTEVFVRRGLTIDFGGTWLLPRLVGLARAKELALTGRVIDAAEALEYGMVAEVVAPDALHGRATAIAAELAAGAPLAQRFIKRGLDRSFEMSFEEAAAYETQAQSLLLTSEDAAEGFVAFLEKRDPDFRGR